MSHKLLKNAGIVPAEVEHMQKLATLRAAVAAASDGATRLALQRTIAEQETQLRVRLEHLRGNS